LRRNNNELTCLLPFEIEEIALIREKNSLDRHRLVILVYQSLQPAAPDSAQSLRQRVVEVAAELTHSLQQAEVEAAPTESFHKLSC
jgi:hypothetical protein